MTTTQASGHDARESTREGMDAHASFFERRRLVSEPY